MRSLATVSGIPVRRPTIISGANDGGKSTCLHALNFLLGGRAPTLEDHTMLGPNDNAEPLRHERIEVIGQFSLDQRDVDALDLKPAVLLRRISTTDGESRYQMRVDAPVDDRFRDLASLKRDELSALADATGIEPNGPRNTRAAWLEPLTTHARSLPHEQAWVAAPTDLISRLPHIMVFSSTDEPDPKDRLGLLSRRPLATYSMILTLLALYGRWNQLCGSGWPRRPTSYALTSRTAAQSLSQLPLSLK